MVRLTGRGRDLPRVARQTVWLLETHKLEDVKLSTLSKIAGALGVPLPDLLA